MTDYIRCFGGLLAGFACAFLSIACECTARAMRGGSRYLMAAADVLWEKAFQCGAWE